MKKILIMISGRGSNMAAIIRNVGEGCLKELCTICEVFSNKADAPGLDIAETYNIPTYFIESKGKKRTTYNTLLKDHLLESDPDLIILAGYMKILSAEIIKEFPNKIINIHPADTAKHQGLHGYEWAWDNQLSSTKVTVHFVDEGLDTGMVIGKKEVDLTGAVSLEEVEERGLTVEHEFYSECIRKILTAKNCKIAKKNL
ncbi:phosphoribosylglycinamide formyltransferase [Candidatus Cloacimonadota bacterium]